MVKIVGTGALGPSLDTYCESVGLFLVEGLADIRDTKVHPITLSYPPLGVEVPQVE